MLKDLKMKKNIILLLFSTTAIFIGSSLMSCNKDNDDEHRDDFPIENENDDTPSNNNDENVSILKIINENVTAIVKYEYYTFHLDLYTELTENGKYFAGRNDIKYGVEWHYSNGAGSSGYYTIDPKNRFMDVTIISSNHYSVVIPIFVWEDDADKTTKMNFFSFQYRYLKLKEANGETLSSDERTLLTRLEKEFKPYINMINEYRGKVFVDIGNKRYYIKSFQK